MGAARVQSPIYLPPKVHKSLDEQARTAAGVLTWHTKDLEGEIINPAGVRVDPAYPYPVDWHHGVYVGKGFAVHQDVRDHAAGPDVYRRAPVGTTHFFKNESDLDGFDTGRYSRAECLDAASQAWELVRADLAPGLSIEIDPLSKVWLGKSLLKPAGAYRYDRSVLMGWAHTILNGQVHPQATTFEIEKALECGRSGKIPGGAAMLPTIRKAFDSLLAANPKNVTVTVPRTVEKAGKDASGHEHAADGKFGSGGAPKLNSKHLMAAHGETIRRAAEADKSGDHEAARHHRAAASGYAKAAAHLDDGNHDKAKAVLAVAHEYATGKRKLTNTAKAFPEDGMADDDYPPMDSAAVDAPPVEEPAAPSTKPTASAAYNFAQGLSDLCDAAETEAEAGEHVKGGDKLFKMIEDVRSYIADIQAIGEMVEADTAGRKKKDEPKDDADPEKKGDEEDKDVEKALAPATVKKAADGSLEFPSGFKARRFSFRDVKPVEKAGDDLTAPAFDLNRVHRRLSRIGRPTRN